MSGGNDPGACAAMLALLLSSGCGEHRPFDAPIVAHALGESAAMPSQDRLPGARAPTAEARVAADPDEAGEQACRTQIRWLCTQASIQSEAQCRVASCTRVAGFWILHIPQAQVEDALSRRGY